MGDADPINSTMQDREKIITGNWKMYKTIDQAVDFVRSLMNEIKKPVVKVFLAVPFTAIDRVALTLKDTCFVVGAQNMNDASEGAFTGEIAGKMLKDAGAEFVLLGHSERRRFFKESNDFINKKVKRAILDGIRPVLCVGETLEQREQEQTQEVLKEQICNCLSGISSNDLKNLILAYEPVWAIGTGQTATPEVAQLAHIFCRNILKDLYGEDFAVRIPIQYGGSVTPSNAKALMEQPDIDGLLVGGASLSLETFCQIVNDSYSIFDQSGKGEL